MSPTPEPREPSESAPASGLRSGIVPVSPATPAGPELAESPAAAPVAAAAVGTAASGVASAAAHGRGLSIAQKLGLSMFVLVLSIVGALTAYFQSREVDGLRSNLERKADTYAQLLAAQVRSAVAFNDRETAREAFQALASDRDLSGVVLFTAGGSALETWGSLSDLAQQAKSGVSNRHVFELSDRVLAVVPVVSLEGPTGTLALELSKAELERGRGEVQRTSLLMGSLALFAGVALAWAIAQSFAKRLRAIARVASLVAAGDLNQTAVCDPSHDEIGSLSRSFGSMLEQLKALILEIKSNAEQEQARLEGLVAQRTRALGRRNDDMRRVLDNVDQGFLTIDRAGIMSEERSRIIESWLGPAPASGSFWDYVEQGAPGMRDCLVMGWEQVLDGLLPLEVTMEQMPRRFVAGTSHFAVDYKPIPSESGELERVLIVLSDVTVRVERQRLEEEEREVLQLFSRVLEDRAGVLDFLAETHRLVEEVACNTPAEVGVTKRVVHTLKGNTALFGLESIAKLCHAIEDDMQESGTNISPADGARLLSCWQGISSKLGRFMEAPASGGVTIDDGEYLGILEAIAGGMPHRQIASLVEAWRLEPVELRLTRLARQAESLAARLQKGPVDVRVESGRVRLHPEQLTDVWAALPHLIRNAVDHGLETPEERLASGKSERASLVLRAEHSAQSFSVEVEDSGRGIDWDALGEVARKKGLPCRTRQELSQALFAEGVSTRNEVTRDSGRGVGAAAVARAVETTGGRIEVFSERGKGTRFRLSWPSSIARSPIMSNSPTGAARSAEARRVR